MKPKIKFSQHALERMEEREISRAMVENTLNFPDKVEKSLIQYSHILVKKTLF